MESLQSQRVAKGVFDDGVLVSVTRVGDVLTISIGKRPKAG